METFAFRRMIPAFVLVVMGFASCTTETSTRSDDYDDDDGGSSGVGAGGGGGSAEPRPVSLSIELAAIVPGSALAEEGDPDRFIVEFTLVNNAVEPNLDPVLDRFRVRTDANFDYTHDESGLQLLEERSCRDLPSIAPGGSVTCRLPFILPVGEQPAQLFFDNILGVSATAPVPALANACELFVAHGATAPPDMSCIRVGWCDSVKDARDAAEAVCEDDKACLDGCEGCDCYDTCLVTPDCRRAYDDLNMCMAYRGVWVTCSGS
ncbi:MAG: hypothetical protein AAGN82_02630 [Myxococcota bacterium]